MAELLIGLGSNLGDKQGRLERALARLAERLEIVRVSSLYRTEPVGYRQQEWFFNAVAVARSEAPPQEILALCEAIEREQQRRRDIPNGPRTIDLDILLYGERGVDVEGLTIPHPRMTERRFVLEPAAEVAAEMIHPTLGLTVGELLARLGPGEQVEKLRLENWPPPAAR
jgi:2-amino-4-hydroxy-6-hydroxymethyldihydropteridine diphosphokinase